MKGIIWFIIGMFVCINTKVNAKEYIFENVTANTGITFNAINKIVEDKYGFIWFGCTNGLYYYNSAEIIKFNFDKSKTNSPLSNQIRYLYADKNDKLWVCTNKDICYFNEEQNSFERLNFSNEKEFFQQLQTLLLYQHKNDSYLTLINSHIYSFNVNDLTIKSILIGEPGKNIRYFTNDKEGNLYFATTEGEIFKGDSTLIEFEQIYSTNSGIISTLSIINKELWIGFEDHGIEVISNTGEFIKQFSEKNTGNQHIISNRVRRIVECGNNDIWIGTLEGLSIINSEGIQEVSPGNQNGLPHEAVFDLLVDRNDGVWVSTWSGGLAYYNKFNYKFPHIRNTTENKSSRNNVISSFTEDKNGTIWVGSENDGLGKFTTQGNTFERVKDFPAQRIKAMASDYQDRLWIATFYEGLWLKENGNAKRIGDIEGIFTTVLPDKQGVWVGTKGKGAIYYDEQKKSFETYTQNNNDPGTICSNSIWKIFKDSKNNTWFVTDNGISILFDKDDHFTNYIVNVGENNLISNVNYTIAEDKNGKIWIGTAGYGIYIFDLKTKTFSKFSLNASIKNAEVYCILRDKDNNMWFSSNQGIYAYYYSTENLKNFTKEDGLLGQQYHPNSGFISKKGIVYFGGGDGFNVINPQVVQPNTTVPEIFLSNLKINNQSFEIQKPKYINSGHISAIEQMELNYDQNSITLGFVVNSFIKNSKSKLKYRLLNYIDEWNEADYNANISFTKIPPGDYTLQVTYVNNDGLSKSPLKEIQIEINPPFWFSWYAYLIYFVLIGTVIFIAVREMRFREKSRANQMLFTEKVKFFTNVSHEFRTPLTLIISPIKSLMKKFANEPETTESLQVIHRNADRLLRLTNQILDFRLIELNSVKLKREKTDIITLCKNVYDCFEFQIREKEINCIFNSSFKSFELEVDAEKIEKVVYNILSNALKFSNERGQIILSIEKKTLTAEDYSQTFSVGNKAIGDVLEIKIKDNGKGIKKSILSNIFERFFMDAENAVTGTGIGLHICQEYIKMHKGNIMVESEPGKETIFSINIPTEQEAIFEKQNIIIQKFFDTVHESSKEVEQSPSTTGKPIILFAEDNNELRNYYKNLLSAKYKVITAKNGTQALEIAMELIPDLILSDILMPGLDGMMLTEQIRKTDRINHIPIILLTALRDSKFEIESMHKGANAFLTKPVDDEMLFAKIDSVLSNADVVKKKYKEEVGTVTETYGSNQTFIEKVEKIVEKNLQNQSFEITELASQVGISRSSLQRKIKKTVNMSPSEFIREVRLKKAVGLLKSDEYNIDEIAIIVGFNSTSYFIRSFKMKYEMTPTAYKQNIEKK